MRAVQVYGTVVSGGWRRLSRDTRVPEETIPEHVSDR